MNILGVSCWYHDSAAALVIDGKVVAASQEERFSRDKHDCSFPVQSIDFCLKKGGLSKKDIDFVVFYDKPIPKFERITSSILYTVPRSLAVFREAIPLWLSMKLKFHKTVKKKLGLSSEKVCFCSHHIAHAASSFFMSGFDESAILTVDGVGEWATATLARGEENRVNIFKEMRFPHSLGLLYSAFTAFLGFKVNNGEYKVMGMAPYGRPKYTDKIYKIVKINEDGSIELNMKYFSFHYSASRTFNKKFINLFGPPRTPDSKFFTKNTEFPVCFKEDSDDYEQQANKNQYYADIAASIQKVLENALIKMARYLKKETGLRHLCYAGGVALNSSANYKLVREKIFDDIFIQPAATDAGGAAGAALWLWHQVLGNNKQSKMETVYLGANFSEEEILQAIKESNFRYEKMSDAKLLDYTASQISDGKVVGWFQGRAEWGPRALGNRSILADPRNPDMKNILNRSIKFRESYRPFAPSILAEDVTSYIEREKEISLDSYMLVTYPVRRDKIIPSVTHINGTARVQSVNRNLNPKFWGLIKKFKELTGESVLVNTSFNLRGEPIVNSPADAIKTFKESGIDILVLENFVLKKNKAKN